jgi:hypothetical protein
MTTATLLGKASRKADKVRTEARDLDPAKVALTLLFLVPFVVGWLLGALWTGLAWAWQAAVEGFRTSASACPRRQDEPT